MLSLNGQCGVTLLKTLTFSSALVVFAAACSSNLINAQTEVETVESTAQATQANPATPLSELSVNDEADLVFRILAAEMAGRRGRVDLAAEQYMSAANTSDDARVAERAVKLAMYSRNWLRADIPAAQGCQQCSWCDGGDCSRIRQGAG